MPLRTNQQDACPAPAWVQCRSEAGLLLTIPLPMRGERRGLPSGGRFPPLLARNELRQLGHFFRQQLNQVIDRQNSKQRTLPRYHGNAAYAGGSHLVDGLEDALILNGCLQFDSHDVADGEHVWIEFERYDRYHDIPVGYDADGHTITLDVVDHQQVAHMVLTH